MPAKLRGAVIDRLFAKIVCDVRTRCWNYVGGYKLKGYGRMVTTPQREELTHRVAYKELAGPLPDDIDLHHICENKACANPEHLRPMPNSDHMRLHRTARRRTHCPHGHPLVEGSLVLFCLRKGRRACLTCQRAAIRAQYHKNKEQWKARKKAREALHPEQTKLAQARYQRAYLERKRQQKIPG